VMTEFTIILKKLKYFVCTFDFTLNFCQSYWRIDCGREGEGGACCLLLPFAHVTNLNSMV